MPAGVMLETDSGHPEVEDCDSVGATGEEDADRGQLETRVRVDDDDNGAAEAAGSGRRPLSTSQFVTGTAPPTGGVTGVVADFCRAALGLRPRRPRAVRVLLPKIGLVSRELAKTLGVVMGTGGCALLLLLVIMILVCCCWETAGNWGICVCVWLTTGWNVCMV